MTVDNRLRIFKHTLYLTLLKDKPHHLSIQLFRYTCTGGIAFIVDFAILFACTHFLNIYYLISAAIAFVFGLTVNYLISIVWVFDRRNVNNKAVEFLVFAVIGVIGLGMTEGIMYFFADILKYHYLVAKIISTVVVYLWNFIVRKLLIFK